MTLVTRCPACHTTFRASPTQLSARGGRVRCGKCTAVFDGVANLLSDAEAAALPEASVPAVPLSDAPEPPVRPEAVAPVEETPSAPTATSSLPEPQHQANAPVRAPASRQPTAAPVPAFLKEARPRAAHTVVWALLSLIALGALGLQAVLHFRTELAVLLPPARPHLATACDILGCEIRLPRRADLMSIESSDLQADSQRPGVIILNALLRNRAPFAQEYPDLELTLTDQGDRPVIRRVLRATDYLQDKSAAPDRGLAGGAEEMVRIHLETGGIVATGYQLFLFYACPRPPASAFWQLSYPSRCQDSRNI